MSSICPRRHDAGSMSPCSVTISDSAVAEGDQLNQEVTLAARRATEELNTFLAGQCKKCGPLCAMRDPSTRAESTCCRGVDLCLSHLPGAIPGNARDLGTSCKASLNQTARASEPELTPPCDGRSFLSPCSTPHRELSCSRITDEVASSEVAASEVAQLCAPPNHLVNYLAAIKHRKAPHQNKASAERFASCGHAPTLVAPIVSFSVQPVNTSDLPCLQSHSNAIQGETSEQVDQLHDPFCLHTHGASMKTSDASRTYAASTVADTESSPSHSDTSLDVAASSLPNVDTSEGTCAANPSTTQRYASDVVLESPTPKNFRVFPITVSSLGGEQTQIDGLRSSFGVDELCRRVMAQFNMPDFAVRLMYGGQVYTSLCTFSLGSLGLEEGSEVLLVQQWGWAKPDMSLLEEIQRKWAGKR